MTSTQLSFLLFGLFVLAMLIWHLVDEYIRPMFIPRSSINALADEMIAKHGDRAEEMAYIEEDRAWRLFGSCRARQVAQGQARNQTQTHL